MFVRHTVAAATQGSLFDQETTLGLRSLAGAVVRQHLTDGAWVDVRPGWLSGSEQLCAELQIPPSTLVFELLERNAIGAVKSINAARMAKMGEGTHHVTLDNAVQTMAETGRDMLSKYKETSLGGLAKTMGFSVSQVEC